METFLSIVGIIFFGALIMLAIVFAVAHSSQKKYEQNSQQESQTRYTISASVSESFHDEVETYAKKRRTTVSEIIRKSVRKYMDEN